MTVENATPEWADRLRANAGLTDIDVYFARFVAEHGGLRDADIFLAAGLASQAVGKGNVCLDLKKWTGTMIAECPASLTCPSLDVWTQKLRACKAVGEPGQRRPLILDDDHRLYLYRYWEYESRLAETLRQRLSTSEALNVDRLRKILQNLFRPNNGRDIDWQKIAAALAVLRRTCIITGGPGTGKTFTIAATLAALLEYCAPGGLRIFLTAPTGKAAARLGESIGLAKKRLNGSESLKCNIPEEVFTIHRLLRPVPDSPYFFYNRENQLPADVVVVDEASMVDLALMSKLLEAVPASTRLIMAGDMDQLASVEAGSVLGDICDRGRIHSFSDATCRRLETATGWRPTCRKTEPNQQTMQDCIVALQKSFRFDAHGDIGRLSRAVNRGRWDDCERLLEDPRLPGVARYGVAAGDQAANDLRERIVRGCRGFLEHDDPVKALAALQGFQILCALQVGPFGAAAINLFAERVLHANGILRADRHRGGRWYAGRPVLVTRNDYRLGLFNGDTGITLLDAENRSGHQLYVFFGGAHGEIRRFLPHRLPPHETAFAMTVHKSQGSEFNEVLLILPDRDYPLLTRELIYTALTRARSAVTIWGPKSVLSASIRRRIQRTSGLRDALWGETGTESGGTP